MQTALVRCGILLADTGESESAVLLLEAFADAERFYVGTDAATDLGTLQVSPDYDPADPLSATWWDHLEFGSPVTTADGMLNYDPPAGKAFRLSLAAPAASPQSYHIWKRSLIG